MKQSIYNLHKTGLLFILCLPLVFTACIFDNLDYCPANVSLKFVYTLNKPAADLFDQQVDSIDLFIYKEDGSFVRKIRAARSSLVNGNTLEFSLPKGVYKALVWANQTDEYYTFSDIEDYEKMRLRVVANANDEVDKNLGSLFYGAVDLKLEPAKKYPTKEVPLVKNTNNIRIKITHSDPLRMMSMGDFTVSIKGSNGEYNSKNQSVSPIEYSYTPSYGIGGKTLFADFTVLRLFKADNLMLIIYDRNGKIMLETPLTEEILKSPDVNNNEDLDRYDKYPLHYKFYDSTNVKLIIDLNDWDVIDGAEMV